MQRETTAETLATAETASWGSVFALTLCVATLIASEFMPVSLLTPIASDLGVTEGTAGQAIAVSGLFAVLTSLSISSVTRGIDRRTVLLGLTLAMILSGVMVAFAPNTAVFMAGRALVGVVIGGFWSMSAATVMRLVSEAQVPRALGLLNGGNALAVTVAAPLGSYLGQYIGWRGAFFAVVPLAAMTLAWLFVSLPSMPVKAERSGTVFRVLRRRTVPLGMAAVSLLFMGQFVLQTYLRPFLETVSGVNTSVLSLILLVIGGAGILGTYLIGLLLKTRLYSLLIVLPLLMAVIGGTLTLLGHSPFATTSLLALWGLIGTAAPVGWWTWLSKALPDDAEAGGGLYGGRDPACDRDWRVVWGTPVRWRRVSGDLWVQCPCSGDRCCRRRSLCLPGSIEYRGTEPINGGVPAMTENSFLPLRRALLGAMFASVALPKPSFAQQRNVPIRDHEAAAVDRPSRPSRGGRSRRAVAVQPGRELRDRRRLSRRRRLHCALKAPSSVGRTADEREEPVAC